MLVVRPSLRWNTPGPDGAAAPTRWLLVLAFPSPYHTKHADHLKWYSDGKSDTIAIPGFASPPPSNLVCVAQLWVWRNADNGESCIYRAAHATTTLARLKAGGNVMLKNVCGESQAVLKLVVTSDALVVGAPDQRWDLGRVLRLPPPMSGVEMRGGLKSNGRVPDKFLRDHVGHLFGDIPVWMACLLYEQDLTQRITESYLRNALAYSVRMLGYRDEAAWIASRASRNPLYWEVLAKVCMFNTQWRPYLFDKTRRAGGLVGFDQFSVIESAPESASGAGDCEDDALSISLTAQCLHAMRYTAFPPSDPLHHLIKLAYGYCCFTADTSINPDGNVMPDDPRDDKPGDLSLHHLTMLVPWSTVAEMTAGTQFGDAIAAAKARAVRRTAGWPMLSLEGTEACRGNCRDESQSAVQFAAECHAIRSSRRQGDGKTPTVAASLLARGHNDAPFSVFERARFYRQLIVLYSADLYRWFSVAMLAPCERGARGAVWKTWVTADSTTVAARGLSLAVVKLATRREQETVCRLSELSPKLMPLTVSATQAVAFDGSSGSDAFLVYREMDLDTGDAETITKAFTARGVYDLLSTQRIAVTDGFTVVAFQFKRRAAAAAAT